MFTFSVKAGVSYIDTCKYIYDNNNETQRKHKDRNQNKANYTHLAFSFNEAYVLKAGLSHILLLFIFEVLRCKNRDTCGTE